MTMEYLSRRRFETMDREPAFSAGIRWTHGHCEKCGKLTTIQNRVHKCGFCIMLEKRVK